MLKSAKPHIGIFGKRNLGKSSLINTLADQDVAIVSEEPGTTTDPVRKAMEIIGFGPVIIIDTAGIDDVGNLGKKRVAATTGIIKEVDMAILVIGENSLGSFERDLIEEFQYFNTPFFIVHNKSDVEDLETETKSLLEEEFETAVISYSAKDLRNFDLLIDTIQKTVPENIYDKPTIIGDIIEPGDYVLLITPIDMEAPAGRLILPQVQTLRDVLDNDAISIVLKETELERFLTTSNVKPKLAVTDSQAFEYVTSVLPEDIPLTGFSILFARIKGDFDKYLEGTPAISRLKDGDSILVMESCSHHVVGDDIGRVKIPKWLKKYTGKNLNFETTAGLDEPPRPVEEYDLVIQCGGCMVTRQQIINRLKRAVDAGVPVTNYGMTIAYCHGVFDRVTAPFRK